MMSEENNKDLTTENIKMGLELSDVDDYEVNGGESMDSGRPQSSASEKEIPKKEDKHGRRLAFATGFVLCAVIVVLLTEVLGLGKIVLKNKYEYYKELDERYGKYYEIMQFISQDPIAVNEADEIGEEELKEIVANTGDPYAQYFTAEEYKEFIKRYAGDYVGIGIGVVEEDGRIVIKSVFEDGPAMEAGLKVEDVIVKVDGETPSDVDEAVAMITGEAGTKVLITVERDGSEIEAEIYRAKIDQDSVAYSPLKDYPDVGYIYITSFMHGTGDEFELAVRDLKADGCDKFIIDLRNNGGGLTDESIGIADYLLPACRIMSEKAKDGTEKVYNSKASSADLNFVVLVNENTASASEILSAAIQDNDAGTIIGTTTFGKGVTQLTHQFKDGSAIKITMTEYFRPSGEKVNGVGITPDVIVEDDGEALIDAALRELDK